MSFKDKVKNLFSGKSKSDSKPAAKKTEEQKPKKEQEEDE